MVNLLFITVDELRDSRTTRFNRTSFHPDPTRGDHLLRLWSSDTRAQVEYLVACYRLRSCQRKDPDK